MKKMNLLGLVFWMVGLNFSAVYATDVVCGGEGTPLKLTQDAHNWTLKLGPIHTNDEGAEIVKQLGLTNPPYTFSMILTIPLDACVLSTKSEASFSCEGGWGPAPAVSFPMSVIDEFGNGLGSGKEIAHYTVSKTAFDLQLHTVSVPRVKFGDVTWRNYAVTFYATADNHSVSIVRDSAWEYRMWDEVHTQCKKQ